jgi:hypothetical protein
MAEALEAQLPPPTAAWCLEHFQGDSYLLTNCGTASEVAPLTAEVWAGLACRVGVMLVAWLHR